MRVLKTYILEADFALQLGFVALSRKADIGFGLKKLIDALLRCSSPLHDSAGPSKGRNRECEHGDVNDKLGNITHCNLIANYHQSAHKHRNDKAKPYKQTHKRTIHSLNLGQ